MKRRIAESLFIKQKKTTLNKPVQLLELKLHNGTFKIYLNKKLKLLYL